MKQAVLTFKKVTEKDLNKLWLLFSSIIDEREYFPYKPGTTRDQVSKWISVDNISYLVFRNGELAGAYIVRPNQPGYGSHIANAAYMVYRKFRNFGVGKQLGWHSLEKAKMAGFKGMQFNLVVSSNKSAVESWKKIGFKTIGTVPGGFHHHNLGYVDAYIMFRDL